MPSGIFQLVSGKVIDSNLPALHLHSPSVPALLCLLCLRKPSSREHMNYLLT